MGAARVSRGGLPALKLSAKAQVAGFLMRAASGCCPVGDVMAARRPLCCAVAAQVAALRPKRAREPRECRICDGTGAALPSL